MDKKTIGGIAVVSALFVGFIFVTNHQQKKYEAEMAVYQAYQDSVAMAERAAMPVVDSAALGAAGANGANLAAGGDADTTAAPTQGGATATALSHQVSVVGEHLAAAAAVAAETTDEEPIILENEVIRVRFSPRGGRITGVTLKDYTRYAPRGERDELIEMLVPESARFDLSFFIKNGLNSVPVKTMDYLFTAEPVVMGENSQVLAMRLYVASDAWIEYRYTLYNRQVPERDYLVDFDIRLVNMASRIAGQSLGIDWAGVSHPNEKGFKNENMYTTLAWRVMGETSADDLGLSEGAKSKKLADPVNWIAFKQQFFSSVLIAREGLSNANVAFDTAAPGAEILKSFSSQMTVPYTPQTESYDMAFYFGPNKYSILKKVGDSEDKKADLYLERLVPLGWGIFGWINRYCVIPVFDFLRNYIGSFGIIIFILVLLVKLVIFPMTYKSYVSMAKMRLIKPQVDELTKKYPKKEDAMKRQQATMELYKKAGINPMGGCIPLLIQAPVLFAMFRFFPASIELRAQSFLWADDLSSFDSVLNLPFDIPFYGDHVSLFALLMATSTFFYAYFSYQQTSSAQPQMAGMKFMMLYLMPIMLLFWANNFSSGLCYYYLLSNLFTIGQTLLIRKLVSDDKIHAVMQANAVKRSNGKKSKFQQRYEEMMRQQEAQCGEKQRVEKQRAEKPRPAQPRGGKKK